MVWMDLEMTGLDPKRHVIVEIATLITDSELNVVAEGPDLVISATSEQLAEMDEVVTSMHRRSGLLSEMAFSNIKLQEAQEKTLEFIKAHIPEPRTAPLCGNSIGTDRRFLEEYMPELEAYLHYRNIDVSSIKELAKRWYPGIMKQAPQKQMGHRALDDVRESIAELAFYRSSLFRETPLVKEEQDTSTPNFRIYEICAQAVQVFVIQKPKSVCIDNWTQSSQFRSIATLRSKTARAWSCAS